MTERSEKILDLFIKKIIPNLTDLEKERLIAFGEGIAFKAEQMQKASKEKPA